MNYVTSGDIAKQTDNDRDSVSYALRKIGIEPVARAGIVRLFPTNAIHRVRDYLESKENRTTRKESSL